MDRSLMKYVIFVLVTLGAFRVLPAQMTTVDPVTVEPVRDPSSLVCIGIGLNEIRTFERATNCFGAIRIEFEDGSNEFVPSSEQTFSIAFDRVGRYTLFCGSQFEDRLGRVETTAACIDAVEIVPTLGQWSLIILVLILIIVSTVSIFEVKAAIGTR